MKLDIELENAIRRIVREEISLMLTSDRKLERTISTYMKSLLYNEFQNVRLSPKSFEATEIIVPEIVIKRLNMSFGDESNVKSIFDKFHSENKLFCEYQTFHEVMIDGYSNDYIDWIDIIPRSKEINQQSIFDLFYELDESIIDLKDIMRKNFIKYICKNFTKGGISMEVLNLDNSFSKWKSKKIEQINK